MAKPHKPDSVDDVFREMKKYCQKKNFNISDSRLKYMAENCYLSYEGKGWIGCKYWPAWVMKWVLNEATKFGKGAIVSKPKAPKGKSVKDLILEKENDF